MIVLAWFPPLWRRVMDPRLVDHYERRPRPAPTSSRASARRSSPATGRAGRHERLSLPQLRLRLRRGGRATRARASRPGTPWSEVPDDWACPDCGVRDKVDFEPVDAELRR